MPIVGTCPGSGTVDAQEGMTERGELPLDPQNHVYEEFCLMQRVDRVFTLDGTHPRHPDLGVNA